MTFKDQGLKIFVTVKAKQLSKICKCNVLEGGGTGGGGEVGMIVK